MRASCIAPFQSRPWAMLRVRARKATQSYGPAPSLSRSSLHHCIVSPQSHERAHCRIGQSPGTHAESEAASAEKRAISSGRARKAPPTMRATDSASSVSSPRSRPGVEASSQGATTSRSM